MLRADEVVRNIGQRGGEWERERVCGELRVLEVRKDGAIVPVEELRTRADADAVGKPVPSGKNSDFFHTQKGMK